MPDNTLSALSDDALYRELVRRRRAPRTGPGRPAAAHACELCGHAFGSRELRLHLPDCRARQRAAQGYLTVTDALSEELGLHPLARRGLRHLSFAQLEKLADLFALKRKKANV